VIAGDKLLVKDIGAFIMRFSPAAIALSLLLATVSSVSFSKRADHEIDDRSIAMANNGTVALGKGDKEAAIGWFETALAVDPRNRQAYIALAEIARDQGLKGKSIRFYMEALEIEPNDQKVLADQALVMLSKGALEPAKKNLARLQLICQGACEASNHLAKAIATAKQKPAVEANAVAIDPKVEPVKP
jgi:tetratricopeptide (TPR) repeat protein